MPSMLLPEHYAAVFASRVDRPAVFTEDGCYTYSRIQEHVGSTVAWLQSCGVRRGDRVAVHMPSSIESVVLYLAVLFSGAVLLPLNPRYTEDEERYFLQDAEPSLAVRLRGDAVGNSGQQWHVDRLLWKDHRGSVTSEPVDLQGSLIDTWARRECSDCLLLNPDPNDLAAICYTSGTTGRPKGAMISHGNLAANAASLFEAWEWQDQDVLLHTLPLFHVHGLFVALQGTLYAGACLHLQSRFHAGQALHKMETVGCTLFMGVPTMYHRFLDTPAGERPALRTMRLFLCGSAPLSAQIFHGFERAFGHTILERYGMTEAGMVLSNPLHGRRVAESVGYPLPGVQVRVVNPETGRDVEPGDVGELVIRSGSVFKGYWRRPETVQDTFLPGGWLKSGDLVRREQDGRIHIIGRNKELIISGGFNVYPKEVEGILEEHPAVNAAAVFGLPDDSLGERAAAAVVVGSVEMASEQALLEHCREKLAAYKCPRLIRFVETLPRNAMGKVQKERLKALFHDETRKGDIA